MRGVIDVMNVDGAYLRHVVQVEGSSLHWLPNGTQIIFFIQSDKLAGTYVVDTNGTLVRRLSLPVDASLPVFSPDGNYLAFDLRIVSHQELYVTDNDLSTEQQLTYGRAGGGTFSWSGNSKQMAFDQNGLIYAVPINTLCRVPG